MYAPKSKTRVVIPAILIFIAGLVISNNVNAQENIRFDSTMVSMSDDVRLSTDIYLPAEEGAYSVVLIRTPYSARRRSFIGNGLAQNGYVVVIQNVRGQNGSEGNFVPFVYEQSDGLQTLEWILKQPWCNGKVALWGSSYYGYTAFELARTSHPAIKALFHVSGWSDLGAFMAHGGAFQLQAHLYWFFNYASGQPAPPKEAWPQIFRTLPYGSFFKGAEPILKLSSAQYDYSSIKVPVMHVTGWYDYIYKNVLQTYDSISSIQGHQKQRLIVGPWAHNGILNSWTKVGDTEFGEKASAGREWTIDLTTKWYDHILNGVENDLSQSKPVKYFVMGDNDWLEDTSWPPSSAKFEKWYMQGDNSLSKEKASDEVNSQFVFDPNNPVPTVGGANSHFFPENLGPKDQRAIGDRDDILLYTSKPMESNITIAGPISAVLYASTTGKDTDFTAKLSVIGQDGFVRNVEDGIVRSRFLFEGTDSTGYVVPNKVYKYKIDCGASALAVKKGERLQLAISSSNFPKYDRNPNTGDDPFYATELINATQTVYHSNEYPSYIQIPVLR